MQRRSTLGIAALSLALTLPLGAGCASTPRAAPVTVAEVGPTEAAAADLSPALASPEEQVRMQKYIDDHVDRRYVRRTFHAASGEVDCVDFDQQPSCRGKCPHMVPPPALPAPPPAPGPPLPTPGVAVGANLTCPAGTVPVARPSMDVLRRFRTLEDYFSKDGHGGKAFPH